jgi:hypothetical protein
MLARMTFPLRTLSAVLVGAALVSACSAPGAAAPKVASLPSASHSATAPPPAAAVAGSRPQERVDSTDDEVDAMWDGYYSCLKDHGHKLFPGYASQGGDNNLGGRTGVDLKDSSPASVAAKAACAGKLPQPPPEEEPGTNPHYADDYRAYLACLNKGGLGVHATDPFGSGWTYDSSTRTMTEDQQRKLDHGCKISAFT